MTIDLNPYREIDLHPLRSSLAGWAGWGACLQEAALSSSGFNEKGGRKVLRDVLGGRSITQSCRQHDVNLRDFEYALQEFVKEIRPLASAYATKL